MVRITDLIVDVLIAEHANSEFIKAGRVVYIADRVFRMAIIGLVVVLRSILYTID
jgi:hypothetical protein